MKIEKLTDDKIRIVINSSDLELENINVQNITTSSFEKHSFFVDLLKKAREDYNFETSGCKLIVETFSSQNEFLVFTVTKLPFTGIKVPIAKRKTPCSAKTNSIYKFDNFDDFCKFCNCMKKIKNFNYNSLSSNISLHYYNHTYYLILKNINISHKIYTKFYTLISEFSQSLSYSDTFENKIIEYGKLIIKKNAIQKSIKYFS